MTNLHFTSEDQWHQGYYTDDGYTYGYYPETMPFRLWLASLIHGHGLPITNFRYLDLGCGQGFNLVIAAINHPESQFVGVDFMPRHVAHGRSLVARLGLTNLQFYECDFSEVAQQPWANDGFDMVVSHGIFSWISPRAQAALARAAMSTVKTGGVFYASYNTLPGWLSMLPYQRLVSELKPRIGADQAIATAKDLVESISLVQGSFLAALPNALASVRGTQAHDAAYLKQEYANDHWTPFWSADFHRMMLEYKMGFLGTAHISESFDQYMPSAIRELLSTRSSLIASEQLKDLVFNQAFRRDIFVRGKVEFAVGESIDALTRITARCNPFAAMPTAPDPFVFKAAGVDIRGEYGAYSALLAELQKTPNGITLGELSKLLGRSQIETAHMALLLFSGGWLYLTHPAIPQTNKQLCKTAIHTISGLASRGVPYRFIPCPAMHGALMLSEFDQTLLDQLMTKGLDVSPFDVYTEFKRLGKIVKEKGVTLEKEEDQINLIAKELATFKDKRAKLSEFGLSDI